MSKVGDAVHPLKLSEYFDISWSSIIALLAHFIEGEGGAGVRYTHRTLILPC